MEQLVEVIERPSNLTSYSELWTWTLPPESVQFEQQAVTNMPRGEND